MYGRPDTIGPRAGILVMELMRLEGKDGLERIRTAQAIQDIYGQVLGQDIQGNRKATG
jgi:hypothetical protein